MEMKDVTTYDRRITLTLKQEDMERVMVALVEEKFNVKFNPDYISLQIVHQRGNIGASDEFETNTTVTLKHDIYKQYGGKLDGDS